MIVGLVVFSLLMLLILYVVIRQRGKGGIYK